MKQLIRLLFCIPLLYATPISGQSTIHVNQHNGERITLPYNKNDLTLEYVGIHFDDAEKIQYQYKMEGVHDTWQMVGTERTARFNNLAAGDYIFHVKAANADGVWNTTPTSVQLTILAPWWWTFWIKMVYLLAAFSGSYALYHFQLERRLAVAEKSRLVELDMVKTKMYTNITHEFRTPLSVIQGVTEQLEGNDKAKNTIQRNSMNLLNLVNQLLDLSKLESGSLPLNSIQGDIINYLSYLIESFESFAQSKSIGLHFLPTVQTLQMDYDPDKLMKMVVNLLSNAIKFTAEGGDIYIQVGVKNPEGILPALGIGANNKALYIKIKDTGIGIPAAHLSNIFERFYQVDASTTRKEDGTGIGLTFTKELVKLFKGSITVESKVGVGSTFTVWLPITQKAPHALQNATAELISAFAYQEEKMEKLATDLVPNLDLPTVLIVEDNKDVRDYLFSSLEGKYQLIFAINGLLGLEAAIQHIPDLIISDVMMPEIDGYELCSILKKDERTSHIPIILLTARVDIDSRIVGLQKGADAYIAKPFNQKELVVQLEQLLAQRARLQKYYAKGIKDTSSKATNQSLPIIEDSLIKKLNELIEANLEKSWTVEELSQTLGMSRSQIYRKIKAVTGHSTTIYIRHIKLKQALILLQTTDQSISEIAYASGFSDPAFFSRCFSDFFGKPPKEMRD